MLKITMKDDSGKHNHVLLIHIPMSPKVHEDTSGESYCRVGNKNTKMSLNERLLLAYARGEQIYETSPVFGSSIDDIERKLVLEYMMKIGYTMSYSNYIYENEFCIKDFSVRKRCQKSTWVKMHWNL